MVKISKKVDYEIICENPEDYVLTLQLKASSHYFKIIWTVVKNKMRFKGVRFKGSPDDVDRIDIPQQFFNYLRTTVSSIFNNVKRDCMDDGIYLVSDRVTASYYIKSGGHWDIYIIIEGKYHNKGVNIVS